MNKQIKKRVAYLALAGALAINMGGCKSSKNSQNNSSSTNNLEIANEVNEDIDETNNHNYMAKDIYVVDALTLSGDKITYLATQQAGLFEASYFELRTGVLLERVDEVTKLINYLEVEDLKEEYTESEIMKLYYQIVGGYPVSKYVDCPAEIPQTEEYNEEYKAADLYLFVGKDNNGKEEIYLAKPRKSSDSDEVIYFNEVIYEFYTDTFLEIGYCRISPEKLIPLCEYIPLHNRKENYTYEELRVILEYSRQIFHKNRDFNSNDSIDSCSLKQKFSEEQVLVLDTSKLTNFGEVEDQKKVHILLLTYANEDKTVFNYSELGSSNDVANLIISETGYTLGYSEKENDIAYIADSELDEGALLPLNEFLAVKGYEDSIKYEAFSSEELQNLEQCLQNGKVLTLSK